MRTTKKTNPATITQRPTIPRMFALFDLMKSAARLEELCARLQDEVDKEILGAIDQAIAEEDGTEPEEGEEE